MTRLRARLAEDPMKDAFKGSCGLGRYEGVKVGILPCMVPCLVHLDVVSSKFSRE